jgi:hypothetical protein
VAEPTDADQDFVVENLRVHRYPDGEVEFFIDGASAGDTYNFDNNGFEYSEFDVVTVLLAAASDGPTLTRGVVDNPGSMISPEVDQWAREHRAILEKHLGEAARGEQPDTDSTPTADA